MSLNTVINKLISYARRNLLLDGRDVSYAVNTLLSMFDADTFTPEEVEECISPDELVAELCSALEESGREFSVDAVADAVMAALSLTPSQTDDKFQSILKEEGSKAATDWLYSYCVHNYYVRRAVLDKNPRFDEGGLTVTINKAKPEFRDPKKAAKGNSVAGGYPKCVICRENEGYAPRNKRTLRTVSLKLGGEDFFWQYSPYGYFNEHGIAVNCRHTPMYVDRSTFCKLMDFVDIFPHYFIGCNAPLPRIGGSVLAHDHFQGGGEHLPLHRAPVKKYLSNDLYPELKFGIPDWPGTVIRIEGKDRDRIADASERIRVAWCSYDNPELGIIAEDKDGVHNAVSPTVIKTEDGYEMNLILRSNITSEQYPDGVFHAHPEFHSIKKESIGLIEAQGLFILPGRLEAQLSRVAECMERGSLDDDLKEFSLVYEEAKQIGGDARAAIRKELGSICRRILENTAVFKTMSNTLEFLKGIGFYG